MLVVETAVFTRRMCELLPDEEYRRLQLALVFRPEQGALVPGGQGLRKLRWGQPGYYWDKEPETVYLLFVYKKSKQADLTPQQAKALGRLIREELK